MKERRFWCWGVLLLTLSMTAAGFVEHDRHHLRERDVLCCREFQWGEVCLDCRFHANGTYWMRVPGASKVRGVWWLDRQGRLVLSDTVERWWGTDVWSYVIQMDGRQRGRVVDGNIKAVWGLKVRLVPGEDE